MTRFQQLGIVLGVALLAVAIWQFAAGGGWTGFWIALIGLALVTRVPMRRYWERVQREDPAAPALQASWMSAFWILVALGLAVTQLAGIGFAKNGYRGALGIVAAFFFGIAFVKAVRAHRRIRNAEINSSS